MQCEGEDVGEHAVPRTKGVNWEEDPSGVVERGEQAHGGEAERTAQEGEEGQGQHAEQHAGQHAGREEHGRGRAGRPHERAGRERGGWLGQARRRGKARRKSEAGNRSLFFGGWPHGGPP